MLEALGVPLEEFISPVFDSRFMDADLLCEQLIHALARLMEQQGAKAIYPPP